MSDPLQPMKELEQRFVRWAGERDDIRMAIVVGSWARSDHTADEWSDLDIGFSTTHPERYLSSDAWLSEIAEVWVWYPDPTGVTRHVLFAGGLDAGIAPIAHNAMKQAVRFVPALRRLPAPGFLKAGIERQLAEAAEYLGRGARVLLDKDGLAAPFLALLPPATPRKALPAEGTYQDTVRHFWFEAVWCAKHLRRGELWFAKHEGCDGRMKALLLEMMEWHARLARGPGLDTWERGRFLEEWGDPQALQALRSTFAHYDEADAWRALVASMELFRRLATETAAMLHVEYPAEVDARVAEWVRACEAGRRAL